jgi:TPR repeat protein
MSAFNCPELLQALDDIERGDFSTAVPTLTRLALEGNPKAQCNLANLYHFGWGVTTNGKKAIELYHAVARQDIRDECLSGLAYRNLATIYTTGLQDVAPDPEKAAHFSARATELGFEM